MSRPHAAAAEDTLGEAASARVLSRAAFLRLAAACFVAGRSSSSAAPQGTSFPPVRPSSKWLAFRADRPQTPWEVPDPDNAGKTRDVPAAATFDFAAKVAFEGPASDANEIGQYAASGRWAIGAAGMSPINSDPAAVVIATADDFELEVVADFRGQGGWFLFLGWERAGGVVISHSSLRRNEYWRTFEVIQGRCDRSSVVTHADSLAPRGVQKLGVKVEAKALSLAVAGTRVVDGLAVPRYGGGRLGFATFSNQYGTKPIRIGQFRIRSLS